MSYHDETCDGWEAVRLKDDTKGRPARWTAGSYFLPNSVARRRQARLHWQSLAKTESKCSERTRKLQQLASTLSHWFGLPLLDTIVNHLASQLQHLPRPDTQVKLFLGYVEALLRDRHQLTIRWQVLHQINETFGTTLTKQDYKKYVFQARHTLGLRPFPVYAIVRGLAEQLLSQRPLSPPAKRHALQELDRLLKTLQAKGAVFRELETAAHAVLRLALQENGNMDIADPSLRKSISGLACRMREALGVTTAYKVRTRT